MMKTTPAHNEKIATITFASVFPHYVKKIQKKGRTVEELYKIIEWLTGFNQEELQVLIDEKVDFRTFFERAKVPEEASLIKGTICGYKVQELMNPLTRKVRSLDKIIDELAQGKTIEKIIRSNV